MKTTKAFRRSICHPTCHDLTQNLSTCQLLLLKRLHSHVLLPRTIYYKYKTMMLYSVEKGTLRSQVRCRHMKMHYRSSQLGNFLSQNQWTPEKMSVEIRFLEGIDLAKLTYIPGPKKKTPIMIRTMLNPYSSFSPNEPFLKYPGAWSA